MMNTYLESNAFLQANNKELTDKVTEHEAEIKRLSGEMVPKDQELRQLTAINRRCWLRLKHFRMKIKCGRNELIAS